MAKGVGSAAILLCKHRQISPFATVVQQMGQKLHSRNA
jgi:hypothetical protein